MNTILPFLIEVFASLAAALLITAYLRPPLKRVLGDLCKTEERAHFWLSFCSVVLIGIPLVISLTYRPEAQGVEGLFFEVIGRLSGTLAMYLVTLVALAMPISFFGLFVPRSAPTESA